MIELWLLGLGRAAPCPWRGGMAKPFFVVPLDLRAVLKKKRGRRRATPGSLVSGVPDDGEGLVIVLICRLAKIGVEVTGTKFGSG